MKRETELCSEPQYGDFRNMLIYAGNSEEQIREYQRNPAYHGPDAPDFGFILPVGFDPTQSVYNRPFAQDYAPEWWCGRRYSGGVRCMGPWLNVDPESSCYGEMFTECAAMGETTSPCFPSPTGTAEGCPQEATASDGSSSSSSSSSRSSQSSRSSSSNRSSSSSRASTSASSQSRSVSSAPAQPGSSNSTQSSSSSSRPLASLPTVIPSAASLASRESSSATVPSSIGATSSKVASVLATSSKAASTAIGMVSSVRIVVTSLTGTAGGGGNSTGFSSRAAVTSTTRDASSLGTGGATGGNRPVDGGATAGNVMSSPVLATRDLVLCGNGTVDGTEECDDGNVRDFDGCSMDCLRELGRCGDGIVQTLLDEECEIGMIDTSRGLTCEDCRWRSSTCGNGTMEPGEACDAGSQNSNAPGAVCRSDCSLARCGDGIVDALQGEECDDGNRVGADGCSAMCRRDRPSALDGLGPSVFEFPLVAQTHQYGHLQPFVASSPHPPVGDTGPAALAVMAAGAAAGFSVVRRRRGRGGQRP